MAVYVDDMNIRAGVPDGGRVVRGRWSHLFADTETELRAFAQRIGLSQAWIQHPGQPHVHFDVTGRMRQRALGAGARPVTWRQAGEFFAERARTALTPADEPVTSLLLVSGPREGVSKQTVQEALAPKFASTVLLVAGGANGVDTHAAELWRDWGGLAEEHRVTAPEWDRNPRGAGHARNAAMVERVKAAGGRVLVFDLPCTRPGCPRLQPHHTHGTSGCARLAEQAGLPVEHYQAPAADGAQPPAGRTPPPSAPGGTGAGGEGGAARGRALRQAAHLYLGHGLLPVPGWGATAGGACACPRGAACPRPGKHPRWVHAGPGERDYSWKPLTCRTHEEVDQRFADGGPYATGNLMLAIPPGMLVVDQDDDDGGPQAIATLAAQFGDLPPTLAHATPHGVHRIYRTPEGWTGRAWVGKDARNPLPPGVDLRVPGQILMAAPSQVPAGGELAAYGPVAAAAVAALPAAYVTAWTPPPPDTARPRRAVPVPPDRAGTAACYVHARVDGIAADLAAHEPGGRGTALYTAALKVGSTLGAARTTPGAGHAAAEWTDQAAEQALMDAAEANGYVAKHGTAAARTAIRSGLRNGLRNPRPLPVFTARQAPRPGTARTPERGAGQAPAAGTLAAPGEADTPGASRDGAAPARQESPGETAIEEAVAAVLTAAGYPASTHHPGTGWDEGFRVHPHPGGRVVIGHQAVAETAGGSTAGDRTRQMTSRYARTLENAGYQVTSPAPGSLTVTPQPGARQPSAAVSPERARQATRAAVAADEAYRAHQFDRARQLIGRAAELDPGRAGLWDQHQAEITAKQLFTQAAAARAAGDHTRAEHLLGQCREHDPRLDAGWHRHLTGIRHGQLTPRAVTPAAERAAGHGQQQGRPGRPQARERGTRQGPGPHGRARPARASSPEVTGEQADPPPEQAGHRDQAAPGAAAGPGQRARHSWQPAGEATKRCTRDGCGLEATRRLHPTERRWLTAYTKDGRTIIAARVPPCGQELPHGAPAEQLRQLATEADRQAGQAFRSGDIDRAYRLLTGARALDPGRAELWDQRETQIRRAVASGQPRQASHSTETAPCPQCGHSYLRPAGESYPCLSCQSEARLAGAGFTADSPGLRQIAAWNHAVYRRADRQQQIPHQQAEADPPEPGTSTTDLPGEAVDRESEKEACG